MLKGNELDSRGNKRSKFWSVNDDPSETVQSHAPQADVKEIIKKYRQVGIIENLRNTEGIFMDVTGFNDFGDVARQAKVAEIEFMKLPSKIREIFHHDVYEWLDTAHDPEKRQALVDAGVIEPTENGDPPADTEGPPEPAIADATGEPDTGGE